MLKPFSIILLFFLAIGLASCSHNIWSKAAPTDSNTKINSLRLYLSHNGIRTTNFEQYYIKDRTFFSECGKILNGTHKANQKNIAQLSDAQITNLEDLSTAVILSLIHI